LFTFLSEGAVTTSTFSDPDAVAVPLTVVGSINQDYFTFVSDFPQPGETILAESASTGLGGKGCNQAVAAAKLGATTRFVGAVGADAVGDSAISAMRGYGVDVTGIARRADVGTGSAYIAVSNNGENTIIVHSGANGAISVGDVSAALEAVTTGILLIQGELPSAVNDAVAAHARGTGLPLIVNAAPIGAVSDEAISAASVLIVNESEAFDLTIRADIPAVTNHEDEALAIRDRFGTSVVVTLGAAGAAVADKTGAWTQPAPKPDRVRDTTGAGDGFVGVLAASICAGFNLRDSVLRAVTAASHAVTKRGIGDSYVTGPELAALLS